MMIKFSRVSAQNFRSFKNFDFQIDAHGLVLVQGKIEGGSETLESNGAGKSSIFSAISWALFGKFVHVSGLKVSGDKVIRRGSTDGTSATVELYAEQDLIRVTRYRGHPTMADKIRLFVNDKEVTQSSNQKTQQAIENIIGTTFDLFSNLISISEASMKESFALESDANRKKILVSALPQFQQFGKARARVKETLDTYSGYIGKARAEKDAFEKAMVELSTGLDGIDINFVNSRIDHLTSEITSREAARDRLAREVDEARDFHVKGFEKNEGSDTILKINDVTKKLRAVQQEISNLNASNRVVANQLSHWKSLDSTCPTCGQEIPKEQAGTHISRLEVEADEFRVGINNAREVELKLEGELHELEAEKKFATDQVNAHHVKVASLQTQLNSESVLINSLVQEKQKFIEIGHNLEQARKITGQKQAKIRGRVDELETLIGVARGFETALKGWLDGFGPRGILAFGLNHVIDVLTQKTKVWLWRLWHEGAMFRFEFTGDDLSKIEARLLLNQQPVDIESLSSGETRRLCISICFGLRETLQVLTGWKSNLLILDEQLDGVDGLGRNQIVKQLSDAYPETSVFVISQFPDLQSIFDCVLTVKQSNGVSEIVLEN